MTNIGEIYAATERRGRGAPIWVWVIGLAAVVLWNLMLFPDALKAMKPIIAEHDLAGMLGYMAGGTTLPAVIVGLVTYVAFLRKRGASPIYYLSLFLVPYLLQVLFVSTVISAAENQAVLDKAQTRTALTEMHAALDTALGKGATATSVSTPVRATGAAGAMEGLVKRIFAQVLADNAAYKAELKAMGFTNMMAPANLRTAGQRAAARGKLQRARLIVVKYRDLTETHVADYKSWAGQLNMPAQARQRVIAGMNEADDRERASRARLWALESATLDELDQMIAVLSASNGRWTVRGDKVMFSRVPDMMAYRAHRQRVAALTAEGDSLRQAAQTRSREAMAKMERDAAD